MWEINMPDKMETNARERYDEYRENYGDITQEQHDEIIEEVFNTRPEFYTRKDVSDYLDNDFLEYTKYIKKYTEWMDENGMDKVLDPVQIMNMCWYIAGKEIHFDSDDEDDVDDDMCDCCVKGWDKPNEWGRCKCWCNKCNCYLRTCKYKCLDVK